MLSRVLITNRAPRHWTVNPGVDDNRLLATLNSKDHDLQQREVTQTVFIGNLLHYYERVALTLVRAVCDKWCCPRTF